MNPEDIANLITEDPDIPYQEVDAGEYCDAILTNLRSVKQVVNDGTTQYTFSEILQHIAQEGGNAAICFPGNDHPSLIWVQDGATRVLTAPADELPNNFDHAEIVDDPAEAIRVACGGEKTFTNENHDDCQFGCEPSSDCYGCSL